MCNTTNFFSYFHSAVDVHLINQYDSSWRIVKDNRRTAVLSEIIDATNIHSNIKLTLNDIIVALFLLGWNYTHKLILENNSSRRKWAPAAERSTWHLIEDCSNTLVSATILSSSVDGLSSQCVNQTSSCETDGLVTTACSILMSKEGGSVWFFPFFTLQSYSHVSGVLCQ